jgi:hypothetical protein
VRFHCARQRADACTDGIVLNHLIANLFTLDVPKYSLQTLRIQKIANVSLALRALDSTGVLTHLDPTSVVDKNPVLVLGLIWRLIIATQVKERPKVTSKEYAILPDFEALGYRAPRTGSCRADQCQTSVKISDSKLDVTARAQLMSWCRERIG